jgi:hypothetical protein
MATKQTRGKSFEMVSIVGEVITKKPERVK